MSAPVSAATLEQVRMKLEAGYDAYGTIHEVLQMWNRVDPAGMPGGGSLISTRPLKLDDDLDDERIAAIVNLEQLALPFAQAEADLYFAEVGRTTAAPPGKDLDVAVRAAVSRAWAHGIHAAIWVNHDDEQVVEQSGAIAAINPDPFHDATWHRCPVVYTNFVAAESVWVAGDGAGTLTFFPEAAGRRIQVSVEVVNGTRYLEAGLRLAVVRRDLAALHRIEITRNL